MVAIDSEDAGPGARGRIARQLLIAAAMSVATVSAAAPPAIEVLNHCYYKATGRDVTFDLNLSFLNSEGEQGAQERYVGWWKAYDGEDDLVSKLILFRRSPLYRQDDNYLRWDYAFASGKTPEQWVYSARQPRIRRIAQRDPDTPALGLIAEDLVRRQLDQDTHTLQAIEIKDGATQYLIESVSKDPSSNYERIVSRFEQRQSWDDCALLRQEFVGRGTGLAKQIDYTWQRVNGAWVWNVVTIQNRSPKSTVIYRLDNVKVNVGLTDEDFSKRRLTRTFIEP
jgi:hypothetical protein